MASSRCRRRGMSIRRSGSRSAGPCSDVSGCSSATGTRCRSRATTSRATSPGGPWWSWSTTTASCGPTTTCAGTAPGPSSMTTVAGCPAWSAGITAGPTGSTAGSVRRVTSARPTASTPPRYRSRVRWSKRGVASCSSTSISIAPPRRCSRRWGPSPTSASPSRSRSWCRRTRRSTTWPATGRRTRTTTSRATTSRSCTRLSTRRSTSSATSSTSTSATGGCGTRRRPATAP